MRDKVEYFIVPLHKIRKQIGTRPAAAYHDPGTTIASSVPVYGPIELEELNYLGEQGWRFACVVDDNAYFWRTLIEGAPLEKGT